MLRVSVALALAMRSAARAAGFSERFALALAIGVGLLPGAQLYVVWAAGAPHGWASAAAIAASAQLVRSGPSVSRATFARVVALVVITALTYQPAVGFFVVGLCLALLSPRPQYEPRALIGRHARALAAAVTIVAVWILAAQLHAREGQRTGLTQHPLHKASWFVTEVLDNATNTFDITPSHRVEIVALAIIAAVIVVISRRYGRRRGPLAPLTLCAALPIIYAPNLLVVAEMWAAYRTLVALSALVLVFTRRKRGWRSWRWRLVSRPMARRRVSAASSLALAVSTAP